MTTTPVSLLDRLQHSASPHDWVRFAELYSPLLLFWARRLGLQEADSNDLAQDVLVRAWSQIKSYRRLPGKRFRGWLWTVTRNRWHELARRPQVAPAGLDESVRDPTDSVGELVEAEYNAYLVNRLLQLMRSEFEPATWQACWAFVVGGRSAAEVATELGITANAVYLAKVRVLRRLRDELEGLLE
jgi:RNA polymerase sigma-70 factor, ECF subfamily